MSYVGVQVRVSCKQQRLHFPTNAFPYECISLFCLSTHTEVLFQREHLHLTEINVTQWGLMSRTSQSRMVQLEKECYKGSRASFSAANATGFGMQQNKGKDRREEKNNWLSHAVDLTKWGRIVIPTTAVLALATCSTIFGRNRQKESQVSISWNPKVRTSVIPSSNSKYQWR